jgi:hypothetical protein
VIQRVQTLYLALAAIVSGGLSFALSMWTNASGTQVMALDIVWIIGLFLLSALLSVISIFKYNNRQTQFVLGRLNIILNFILLGVIVYLSLTLSGETAVSEKGIGMILPLFSIVFFALANKAIKKDEDLVKSVDRLR